MDKDNKIKEPLNNWMLLFSDCIQELSKHNINIVLVNRKSTIIPKENTVVSGGYFDHSNKKKISFVCVIGHPFKQWSPIFVHEYCHFLQWLDNDQQWKDYYKLNDKTIDKIFHNKPVTKEALEKNLNICKNLELDCEKRTVALLKKYKIDIDISEYIRNANVYIHFYNYMKQYRQWYTPNNVPYKIPALLNTASPTFYKNYDEIPEKLLKEYEKYFPPKKKNNIIK